MAHNVYGGPPPGSFVGPPPRGSFVGPPPPSNFTGGPPPPPGPAVYGGAPPPPPATFGLAPPPPGSFGAPGPPSAFNAPSPAPFAGPIPPGGPPGGALNGPPPRGRKRLIVTCDGTWLDSDNGLVDGKLVVPSNVVRIAWAIKPLSSDGVQQIVYYQAGIASTGGWIDRAVGGATGIGLSEHVQAAYNFLAVNYIRGDEIILIGFSRGAFTARSVGGLIDGVGLLTRKGLPSLSEIYEDYQQRHNPNYRPQYPDNPFPNKPSAKKPAYRQELQRLGLTILDVRIKAIGVWETVGSLGIPRIPIFTGLGLQSRKMKDYSFYDTSLGMGVENAFQALALDEHRAPFAPALWEKRSGSNTNLKQVWFPGVHSNVGGGYADMELANITLAWMISRLEPFLDFNNDFILEQFEINRRYYKAEHEQPRPWSWGKIYNSLTGVYVFAGKKTRTPGAYCRVDPRNGRATNKLLKSTNEYIHPSVRTRIGTGGQGVEDRGRYESKALLNWEFTFPGADEISPTDKAIHQPRVTWRKKDGKDEEGQTEMPESILMEAELQLLETNKKIEEYVMSLPKLRQPKGKRRSKRYD